MRALQASSILALTGQALGHGYIYRATADNTVYPGWDVRIDGTFTPPPTRIAFGGGGLGPITNLSSPDMACNTLHRPTPGTIAEARAGSQVTFAWSHWLHSHKGPITAWLAPYEGDIAAVDVTKLGFVKFAEDTIGEDGRWANVRMMDDMNGTWTATIPADIKPGNYVIRHELIALHFAISTPPGFGMFSIGPQFYMTCFNFKITGTGQATPQGVAFPGAYKLEEPGFHFDVNSTGKPYPPVGPAVYKSKMAVRLAPKDRIVVSPTGDPESDAVYYNRQYQELVQQGQTTSYFDAIGG